MHAKLNVGAYGKDFSINAMQHVSEVVKVKLINEIGVFTLTICYQDVKFERTSRLDAMI
jgi:hypothetical protein